MRKPVLVLVSVFLLLCLLAGTVWASMWGTYVGYPVAQIKVNGQTVTPSSPAIVINGRTYVPLRFVSEVLGAQVDWDGENYTVIINTGNTGTNNEAHVADKRIGQNLPQTFSEKGVSVTLSSLEATPFETTLKVIVTNNTTSEVMFDTPPQLLDDNGQPYYPSPLDWAFFLDIKPGKTKKGVIKYPPLPGDVNTVKFYLRYFIAPGINVTEEHEAQFEVKL